MPKSRAKKYGSGPDLSGLAMALVGAPEAAGAGEAEALALAEGPNGPVAMNTPRQLFSKPTWGQRFFNAPEVAAQARQQGAYEANFTLAQQAARLGHANAMALENVRHTNTLSLEEQRAILNENARQRAAMAVEGFAEDDRIRKEREQDGTNTNIGQAFHSSNPELVPQGFNKADGTPDFARIGKVAYDIIGSQGKVGGFMGLGAQQSKNNENIASSDLAELVSKQKIIGQSQPAVQGLINTSITAPLEAANAKSFLDRDYWNDTRTLENKVAADAKGTMMTMQPNEIGLSLNRFNPSVMGRMVSEEPIMNQVGGMSVYSGHNRKVFGKGGYGPSVEDTVAADIKELEDLNEARRIKANKDKPSTAIPTTVQSTLESNLSDRVRKETQHSSQEQLGDLRQQIRLLHDRIKAGGRPVSEWNPTMLTDSALEQKNFLQKAATLEELRQTLLKKSTRQPISKQ